MRVVMVVCRPLKSGSEYAKCREPGRVASYALVDDHTAPDMYTCAATCRPKNYQQWFFLQVSPRLRLDIRRRSAIEPIIGHMKNDGLLRRNWLNGAMGDYLHAVLCGCGQNLRLILKNIRLFYALIVQAWMEQERERQCKIIGLREIAACAG